MSSVPALVARVYRSTWFVVVLRLVAVGVALVTLGWIGRSASAEPVPSAPIAVAPLASTAAEAGTSATTPPAPPAPPSAPPAQGSRARASSADPVFINHASVDELRRLPGVGPKKAEAILVLRQRVGRFHRVEDLMRVKGIGRSSIRKWRPLVRLDTPPAPTAADGGSP